MLTRRKPKRTRVGKTGIARLGKKDMDMTRQQVYFRANGYCQMRQIMLDELWARADMSQGHKEIAADQISKKCWRWVSEAHGHDAHIRTKRNNGDGMDNRVWSCPLCHIEAGHNAYGKPVPPKPVLVSGEGQC